MDQAMVAEQVEIAPGLGNTVAVLRSKAGQRSTTVSIDVEPGLPRVRGFAGELNQIWGNLIDNALDAVSNGGKVQVKAVHADRRVIVSVIDDGPGIPANVREHIFDPFFTTKATGRGTGLGLSVSYGIIKEHAGKIDVRSTPGKGTSFHVEFPAVRKAVHV